MVKISHSHFNSPSFSLVWNRLLQGCIAAVAACSLPSCVVERTVSDSQGNVIYQEPDVVNPFSSPQKEMDIARDRSKSLGW